MWHMDKDCVNHTEYFTCDLFMKQVSLCSWKRSGPTDCTMARLLTGKNTCQSPVMVGQWWNHTHTHIYIRYIHTYLYRTVWYSGLGLVHTMNRTIHFYILHFREAFIILLLQSSLFVLHLFLIIHTRKRGRFSCKTLLLSLKNVRNFTKQ